MKKHVFSDSQNAMRYVVYKVMSRLYYDENTSCTFDDFVGLCYHECKRLLRKSQWYCPSMILICKEAWGKFGVF